MKRKIWFDTEFMDTGTTIDLISIGLVRDDGAEYYAEAAEADLTKANLWVQENVIKHLTGVKTPREQIAQEIRAFCGPSPDFIRCGGKTHASLGRGMKAAY